MLIAGAAATAWRTTFYFSNDNTIFGEFFERASYILLAGVSLASFAFFSKKMKRLWAKLLLAFAHSALFIVAIFFENSFYQYIHLNEIYRFDLRTTYAESIRMSWHYYVNSGRLHYVVYLLLMLAFCAMIIVWRIPKFVEFRSELLDRIFMVDDEDIKLFEEYTSVEEALSDLDNNTHVGESIRYLLDLERTEEIKTGLIRCAIEHRTDSVFYVLFDDYKEMLTKDEYITLRTAFLRNAQEYIASYEKGIDERISGLDEYYGIEDGCNPVDPLHRHPQDS